MPRPMCLEFCGVLPAINFCQLMVFSAHTLYSFALFAAISTQVKLCWIRSIYRAVDKTAIVKFNARTRRDLVKARKGVEANS